MFTKNYYLGVIAQNTVYAGYHKDYLRKQLVSVTGDNPVQKDSYGEIDGGSTDTNFLLNYLVGRHMKAAKSALVHHTNYVTNFSVSYGVCFGNGTAPESYNDYTMSGELMTSYTESQTITGSEDELGCTKTALYTITNSGSEPFTISEVGLIGYVYVRSADYSSRYIYDNILLERTLLDVPITIEAGGVGQVTYTLRYEWPTT